MPGNPLLIGQVEEIDLLPPTIRKMMDTPGVYILGDTQRPDFTFVLAVLSPGKAHFMSPDAGAINPERFLATVTLHGPYRAGEDVLAELAAARARLEEVEVACAQAVEFATYVEQAAKGRMVEKAKHFMSLEYSQELHARLKPPPAVEPVDVLVLPGLGGIEVPLVRGADGKLHAQAGEWHAGQRQWQPMSTAPKNTLGVALLARMTCCTRGLALVAAGRVKGGDWIHPGGHTFEYLGWAELPPIPDPKDLLREGATH